ncbi:hypothetical protein [Knoellia sp. LjRoot47]|uniref:hypothetical protein n=1 Tax=Knoellia sp. LjRoot47 TaxID=3342330 RepID=UPI003ECC2C9A
MARAALAAAADVLYATTSAGALYQVTIPTTAAFAPRLTLVRAATWTFDQLASVPCGSRFALMGLRTAKDHGAIYRVDSFAGTSSVIRGAGSLGPTWTSAHTTGAWDTLRGPNRR